MSSNRDARSRRWEVERDRHGVMFSGPLEVGECVEVVPAADYKRLADAAELAVTAALDLLPVVGSWNRGYRLSPHAADMTDLRATPEEWVNAAYYLACLHAALEGLPDPDVVASSAERPTDLLVEGENREEGRDGT